MFNEGSVGTKEPKVHRENIPYTVRSPPAASTTDTSQDRVILSFSSLFCSAVLRIQPIGSVSSVLFIVASQVAWPCDWLVRYLS